MGEISQRKGQSLPLWQDARQERLRQIAAGSPGKSCQPAGKELTPRGTSTGSRLSATGFFFWKRPTGKAKESGEGSGEVAAEPNFHGGRATRPHALRSSHALMGPMYAIETGRGNASRTILLRPAGMAEPLKDYVILTMRRSRSNAVVCPRRSCAGCSPRRIKVTRYERPRRLSE